MLLELPLFFSLFYAFIVGVLASASDYPNQTFSLQRKNSNGLLERVATFSEPVSQDFVLKKFGPGYYILRACKPRFKTIWKALLGEQDPEDQSKSSDVGQNSIQDLKQKTDLLTWGVAATGIGELIGFPLAHFRFVKLENQVAEIIGAVQNIPAVGLMCPKCRTPINYLLQPKCNSCQVSISWSIPQDSQPDSQRKQWLP
ncbi:MAG TPA: hypothetical protein VNA15_08435 [Candidatus Angelobacter sp.]|nr:hypothetical protein [Candidatus Angelobacter sp.]